MEAIRMMKQKSPINVATVMLSYVPIPSKVGEMKTKPTQHAVRLLNGTGIFPDFLLCRATQPLDQVRKEKLSLFCNIPVDHIFSAPDVDSIYDIPDNFAREKLDEKIIKVLNLSKTPASSGNKSQNVIWKKFITNIKKSRTAAREVHIALVGKYFEAGAFTLADSYISVIEALKYSAYAQGLRPILTWVNASEFENDPKSLKKLSQYDGVLVPGGFGSRGVEGIISAINYVRKNNIPYFGICYGMQLATIEYARSVAKISDAHTTEVAPKTPHPIIHIMHDQVDNMQSGTYGGNMRLGDYTAKLTRGSLLAKAYGQTEITERHRHRYEVNNDHVTILENKGLVFSGKSPDGTLCECIELPTDVHPFFVAVQYHPEFLARPLSPHPLFSAFIKASSKNKK
jgi:CTP synthase